MVPTESERRMDRLPPCQVCQSNASLYCCPRCSTRTCSLQCCKRHKSQSNCNGKRDRAAFCPLSRFSDGQLASDYHFLEDVLKCGERADRFLREEMGGKARAAGHRSARGGAQAQQQPARAPVSPLLRLGLKESTRAKNSREEGEVAEETGGDKRRRLDVATLRVCSSPLPPDNNQGTTRSSEPEWLSRHPAHLKRLVRAAMDRGITLLLMSPGMVRRKANTTTYSPKNDVIRWRVEWRFHLRAAAGGKGGDSAGTDSTAMESTKAVAQAGPAVVTVTVDSCPESLNLSDLLSAHLDVRPDGANRATRSRLKSFTSVPRTSNRILTKVLPCPASKPLYTELLPCQSLGEAMKGLTIVEFPVLEVVREEDLGCFPRRIEEYKALQDDCADRM